MQGLACLSPPQHPILGPSPCLCHILQPGHLQHLPSPIIAHIPTWHRCSIQRDPGTIPTRSHCNPQHGNVRQPIAIRIQSPPTGIQRPSRDRKVHKQRLLLHQTLSVIHIQRAGSRSLNIKSGDEGPRGVAARGCGEQGFLLREHGTAADVDGDVAQRGVDGGVGVWEGGDGGLIVPIVPAGAGAEAGEDAVDGGGALVEGGSDEEGGAEEELAVDCEEGGCRRLVFFAVIVRFS